MFMLIFSSYLNEIDLDQLTVADLARLEKELETALVQTRAAKGSVNVWTSTLFIYLIWWYTLSLELEMYLNAVSLFN